MSENYTIGHATNAASTFPLFSKLGIQERWSTFQMRFMPKRYARVYGLPIAQISEKGRELLAAPRVVRRELASRDAWMNLDSCDG